MSHNGVLGVSSIDFHHSTVYGCGLELTYILVLSSPPKYGTSVVHFTQPLRILYSPNTDFISTFGTYSSLQLELGPVQMDVC